MPTTPATPTNPTAQPARTSHALLYDDGCPMCTFQMKLITWLDWFNRIDPIALSSPLAVALAPELSRADLLEQIHCISIEGDIFRGARAIRFIGLRLPLLFPLALILWFPGVIQIAQAFYLFVANNRQTLSKVFGCKGACAITPQRKSNSTPPPPPTNPNS